LIDFTFEHLHRGMLYTESLYDFVGHQHFLELIQAEAIIVHRAEVSSNNYGEFLVVIANRSQANRQEVVGFWGLWFHDRRDRYLLDDWHWYVLSLPVKEDEYIGKAEVLEQATSRHLNLGSKMSRRPSPMKLNAITSVAIARPGNSQVHHWSK
jgi:hypothetical protein